MITLSAILYFFLFALISHTRLYTKYGQEVAIVMEKPANGFIFMLLGLVFEFLRKRYS